MEEKIPVQRMLIHYRCDKCKDGYMMIQNKKPILGSTNNTVKYYYECNKCEHTSMMSRVYPMVGDDIPDDIPMPNIKGKKT